MSMPEFEPTDQQRESVSCLAAGGHLTVEQIAKTVINPRTGKPVGARTLRRIFHKELGRHTDLQALVIKRFTEAVDRGEPWAVKLGMEYVIGIKNEETKAANTATENNNKGIKYIHFVRSHHRDAPIPGAYDLGPSEYRALAPPTDIPLAPYKSEPTVGQEQPAPAFPPNHIGKYRTEMDGPGRTAYPKQRRTGQEWLVEVAKIAKTPHL